MEKYKRNLFRNGKILLAAFFPELIFHIVLHSNTELPEEELCFPCHKSIISYRWLSYDVFSVLYSNATKFMLMIDLPKLPDKPPW